MEKLVDIYIASLWRQGHVVKTVKSLLLNPEVGSVTISCSKKYTEEQWKFVNDALKDSRITILRTDDAKGSNEKLKQISNGSNYYVALCDDDLIYPPDYFNKLIQGCEKYNAHVSLHGVILFKGNIMSYYHNRQVFKCLGTVDIDYVVDITASCATLFKRDFHDNLNKWYDFCSTTSMDDIYVSYFAKKKGLQRIVLAHNEGYVKHKEQFLEDEYVFDKNVNNDRVQTEFINKYFNVF